MKHIIVKRLLLIFALTSLLLLLSAESDTIKLKYTSILEKGFSKVECMEVLKGDIDSSHRYEADNMRDEFEIQIITIDKDYLNTRYILLFRNDVLDFWGFPHEFARHDNELYNNISNFCIKLFEEEEKILKRESW